MIDADGKDNPWTVIPGSYECTEGRALCFASKKILVGRNGLLVTYDALFRWALDKAIMEPRKLVQVKITNNGEMLTCEALFGPIEGMDLKKGGIGH